MREVGDRAHDATGLAAEQNAFRYRPRAGVLVRCGADVSSRARELLTAAAATTRTRVVWSEANEESPSALSTRLPSLGVDRLRIVGADADTPGHDLRRTAHVAGVAVDDAPPVSAPEVELPRWLREQSVTITTHRHGRLTGRRHDLAT
jgi:hypothetical protein